MVHQLLSFFYNADYNLPESLFAPGKALNFHVGMYILADKYGTGPLKRLALQKLDLALDNTEFTEQNIAAFLDAVRSLYGTVLVERDMVIQDLLTSTVTEHRKELKLDGGFMALVGSGLGGGLFDRDVVKALL